MWANPKVKKIAGVLFWVALWQFAAVKTGREVLLASPYATLRALADLWGQPVFWHTLMFSFSHIMLGFVLATAGGVVLAVLSARSETVRRLLAPMFSFIKSVPVASFIILLLLWVSGGSLSVCISFLMVLPVVYNNMLAGLVRVDRHLLEMAQVFRLSLGKKIRYIYIPQLMPYFTAACTTALGLCWKSGIAAEVIGIAEGTIGNRLYETKLYMETAQLFAWTIVIVLISFVIEKGFLWLLEKINEKIRQGFL